MGGTTLLTSTYSEAEKGRAQAANDMTVFAVGLTCSFAAGALLEALGWAALNLLLVPWLVAAALALSWHAFRQVGRWPGSPLGAGRSDLV